MMTLDTFAAAVARMRTAQQDFFRKKTPASLTAAKNAEKEVDRYLTEMAPTNVAVAAETGIQTRLFGV